MADADTYMKYGGGAIVALGSIALGIQQLVKRWSSNSAEVSVLHILHEELERMAKQNASLSALVNTLQLEATKINMQLGKLQIENQKLHAEVLTLTMEVVNLRTALPKAL